MQIKGAKNPAWANEDKTIISLDVQFEGQEDYWPFMATADDCMDYGRDLFKRAKAGEFGKVRAFAPQEGA